MPQVKVKEGEPVDVAIRRFKRSCEKAGAVSYTHLTLPTILRV